MIWFFYIVAAGAATLVASYGAVPPYMAWPVIVWYLTSLCLDICGTVRAGRAAIKSGEMSIPFRLVTIRAGPMTAIPCQIMLEMCLAFLVAPPLLGYHILHMPAAAAFCAAAAASHTYGFAHNMWSLKTRRRDGSTSNAMM